MRFLILDESGPCGAELLAAVSNPAEYMKDRVKAEIDRRNRGKKGGVLHDQICPVCGRKAVNTYLRGGAWKCRLCWEKEDKMQAVIKQHPNDPSVFMFWDIAMQEPNAFYIRGDRGWSWNGDEEKPTVTPSILLTKHNGYRNHLYIREGKIQYLSDCTHAMAGQTVDMMPFPEDW